MHDPDQLFPEPLVADAAQLIDEMRLKHATLTFAESCTGGLLSALLTSVAGEKWAVPLETLVCPWFTQYCGLVSMVATGNC